MVCEGTTADVYYAGTHMIVLPRYMLVPMCSMFDSYNAASCYSSAALCLPSTNVEVYT